jgi:hypothetical protein
MVGIVVDDDVIVTPIPVVDVAKVEVCNAEVIPAEPESAGTASAEPPYETRAESALEVAMFPGMVKVVVDARAFNVMPDPLTILVDVRGFGMAFLVAKRRLGMIARWSRCILHWPANVVVGGRWSAARDVAATNSACGLIVTRTCAVVIVLSKNWERQD